MKNKSVIWSGSPSQLLNVNIFSTFILSILFYIANTSYIHLDGAFEVWLSYSFMIVSGSMAFWSFLTVKTVRYSLTKERLSYSYGVINQEQEPLELYRVKDYSVLRPWYLRLFGLETVLLISSDRTNPVLSIDAIPKSAGLLNIIRENVEICRTKKGVRELDLAD